MDELEHQLGVIVKVSKEVVRRGWAEATTGNLSILLSEKTSLPIDPEYTFETGLFLPQLEGRLVLMTRAGSRFVDLDMELEENIGLYHFGRGGTSASLIWGAGAPSTEWFSHLLLYAYKGNRINSVLHCHMDEASALDSIANVDPSGIPDWITWLNEMDFGTRELAVVTLQELGNRDTVYWKGHGVLTVSSDIESALSSMIRFSDWISNLD